MVAKVKYQMNPHQEEFHMDMISRRLHLSSGFGGGKTYALIMKMLALSRLNYYTHGGLMVPTYTDFKRDVLPLCEDIFQDNGIPFDFHGTDHTIKFPWTRKKVFVVTAERKIRGPNWGYALINELTLCPLIRYQEVIGRVRDKRAKVPQIASVGTPEGMASEYYDYMIEKPRENFRIIYGDSRNNQSNLSETYIDDMMQSYDSIMQDSFIRGLWVNMASNRFYYSYDPKRNDNKRVAAPDEYDTVHVSMDFNVDPMSAVCWEYDGLKIRAFDEITIPGREGGADTKMMCEALKSRGYGPERVIIYPDPAGAARSTKGKPDHQILRENGFERIRYKSQAPRMRQRQLNVNNLLEKGFIELNPDLCPELKKDLERVEQDPGTLEKVKKDPKRTHHSDGMDCMCDILFPMSGNHSKVTVEKYR